MSFHRDLGFGNVHVVHAFEYADAAARAAAAGLVPADIGKVARQLDDNTFWVLQDDSPVTWAELTSAGGSFVPTSRQVIAGAGLTGGGDLTVDRTLNVGANPDGSIVVAADTVGVGVLASDAQHGARGGGTQHATAIAAGAAGFLSGADKDVLDKLVEAKDEGTSLGTGFRTINFTGAGVTASDAGGGQVNVAIPGAGTATITVLDEGSALTPDKNKLNFIGPGIAATTDGGDPSQANVTVTTAAPGAAGVATTSGEGTAASLARSDHTHQSNTAPANVTKAAAAIGISGEPARADHKHDVSTAAVGNVGDANAEGTATSLARSDHTHKAMFPILLWGNNAVSSTTTTRFLTPGYTDGVAPTTAIQFRVPTAGTLRNLRVRQNTGAGNGNNIVYTVRVNGVATSIAATLASTANDGNDLTNTAAIAAGDLVDVQVTKAVSVGTSPADIVATLEVFV